MTALKKVKIPQVEDHPNAVHQTCVTCRQPFVANEHSPSRVQCYICKPPADPILFAFKPIPLGEKARRPSPKKRPTAGEKIRADALVEVSCWCALGKVFVSKRLINAGKTKSCGRPSCKE